MRATGFLPRPLVQRGATMARAIRQTGAYLSRRVWQHTAHGPLGLLLSLAVAGAVGLLLLPRMTAGDLGGPRAASPPLSNSSAAPPTGPARTMPAPASVGADWITDHPRIYLVATAEEATQLEQRLQEALAAPFLPEQPPRTASVSTVLVVQTADEETAAEALIAGSHRSQFTAGLSDVLVIDLR